MTATPVSERAPNKLFRRQIRNLDLTTLDEERREVLDSVRDAMRRKTIEPACMAACRFLLQHLAAPPACRQGIPG